MILIVMSPKMPQVKIVNYLSRVIALLSGLMIALTIVGILPFWSFLPIQAKLPFIFWLTFYSLLFYVGIKGLVSELKLFSFYGFFSIHHFMSRIPAYINQKESLTVYLNIGKWEVDSYYVSILSLSADLILGLCLLYFLWMLIHDLKQR